MDHHVRALGPAEPVPVFNCEVLVGPVPDAPGRFRARVANLPDLEVEADSELAALKQLVPLFKQHVAAKVAASEPIAWLQPSLEPAPHEQQRLIAVHL